MDFEADASDLVGVLGAGAHLIGHSYGGVVALIAASSRPELIRSLTLFEPAAMGLAADDPSVMTLRARLDGVFPAPHGMTPGRWLATFMGALGWAVPPELPVADGESANIKASMGERPPWEARPDLDGIRTARLPVLIVRGDWAPDPEVADPEAAAIAGSAFKAIAEVIADGTGGTILVAPGATHNPQLERSDLVVPVVRQHLERAAIARDRPLSTRAPDAREIAER